MKSISMEKTTMTYDMPNNEMEREHIIYNQSLYNETLKDSFATNYNFNLDSLPLFLSACSGLPSSTHSVSAYFKDWKRKLKESELIKRITKASSDYILELKDCLVLVKVISRNINHETKYLVNIHLIYNEKTSNESKNEIIRIFREHYRIEKVDSSFFYMISATSRGLDRIKFPVQEYQVDLESNYNNIEEIHEFIKEGISNKDEASLILLRSEPGCGKTHYIRQLVRELKDKDFYFIQPNNTSILSQPDFITFAASNLKDSVLIIEDAEEILRDRDKGGNTSAVSNILNMCDGLLKDALNLKIICTINGKYEEIDRALKRRGRLLLDYEFERLSLTKSKNLLKKLNKDPELCNEPMKLCDIYNMDQRVQEKEEHIGFIKR